MYYHDMQNAKENAIKAIEKLPEESTYEDIMERLLFIQKVESGLEDVRQARVTSDEDVKKRLAQWLK